MAAEVVAALTTPLGGRYADLTLGDGGHAHAILEAPAPSGCLLGLDRDAQAIAAARANLAAFAGRVHFAQADFTQLRDHLATLDWEALDGVLLDLGLRSSALDDPERGFSFRVEGPLDMRFDPTRGETAAELLARIRPDALVTLLADGTTRADPRRIARGILEWRRRRPLRRTTDLTECLRASLGRRATPKLFASVFATVRMAVNGELEALERVLDEIPLVLKPGGVLCVLAYQSQEDRRVKQLRRRTFHDPASGEEIRLALLWDPPRRATREEARRNSRARSARLRAFRRISDPQHS
jgi:16S rRNA (cytosine1402-N4)-methyltransferase